MGNGRGVVLKDLQSNWERVVWFEVEKIKRGNNNFPQRSLVIMLLAMLAYKIQKDDIGSKKRILTPDAWLSLPSLSIYDKGRKHEKSILENLL